jgi:hypothetical protein
LVNPCCTKETGTNRTLCFGGTDVSRQDLNSVWAFDNDAKTWSELFASTTTTTGVPVARRLAQCAVVGGKLRVFGGYRGKLREYVEDASFWSFSITTATWSDARNYELSVIARDHTGFAGSPDDGVLYYWGGGDKFGHTYNDLYEVDFNTARPGLTKVAVDREVPDARYGHTLVASGGLVYSLFGKLADGSYPPQPALWSLNVSSREWKLIETRGAVSQVWPPSRTDSCVVMRGIILYMFGGDDTDGNPLDDLWTLNMRNYIWTQIPHSGSAHWPSARSAHTCFLGDFTTAVFGLGHNSRAGGTYYDTWYGYEATSSSWLQLRPTQGSVVPSGRKDAVSFQTRDGEWHIGFGRDAGTTPFSDVYKMTAINATHGNITFANVSTSVNYNTEALQPNVPYQLGRAMSPAVAAAGREFLFCGGFISSSFGLHAEESCVALSLGTGEFLHAPAPPLVVTSTAGVYIGSQFVMFGGRVTNQDYRRSVASRALQILSIPDSAKCPTNPVEIDGCLLCSRGTVHPACTDAPVGFYVDTPGKTADACPAGTYGELTGLSDQLACANCPFGTYNNQTGQQLCTRCPASTLCSLATVNPLSAENSPIAETFIRTTATRTVQPPPYSSIEPPIFVYLSVVFIFVLGLIVIAILIFINLRRKEHTIATYFSSEARNELQRLFDRHARTGYGVDETGFVAIVAADILQPNKISGVQALNLFQDFDVHGLSYLDFPSFLDLVASVTRRGMFPALDAYGGETEEDVEKRRAAMESARNMDPVSRWIQKQDVAALDMFEDRHVRVRPGEFMRMMRTTSGGTVSIMLLFGAIAIIVILTAQYFFDNVVQTTSTVPSAVIQSQYTDDASPEVGLFVSITLVNAQVRQLSSTSTLTPAVACANADGTCRGHTEVWAKTDASTKLPILLPITAAKCYFDATNQSCVASMSCPSCIPSTAEPLTFYHRFSERFYAQGIKIHVVSATGIRDPEYRGGRVIYLSPDAKLVSEFYADVASPTVGNVFVGEPATEAQISLTPTYFTAPKQPFTIATSDAQYKGAMLYNDSVPVAGNTVDAVGLDQAFGVPVNVKFNTATSAVLVTRSHRQSEVQLISALLGGVSGFAALLTVLVQKLDMLYVMRRQKLVDAEQRKRQKEFEQRSLREETDPNFAAAAANPNGPDGGGGGDVSSIIQVEGGDEQQQEQQQQQHADVTAMPMDDVTKAKQDFLFKKLEASFEERKLVAGLVASGMPLHVALAHLQLVQSVADAGERERTMQAPSFPNVDRFLRHQRGGGARDKEDDGRPNPKEQPQSTSGLRRVRHNEPVDT